MKIVQINTVPNGSTGTIMMNIHKYLLEKGHESYVVWGRGRKPKNKNEISLNNFIGTYYHALHTRITGKTGDKSRLSTKYLIKKIDEIKPDIIHLHNIHGYYINIEMLFNYLKEKQIRVIWTFHDCWPFTGHCAYFDLCHCDKWKECCENCPQINTYPKSIIDASKKNYIKKQQLFNGIKDMTIVTPSKWLENLVKKSFLRKYNTLVINNGINTKIFTKLDKNKINFKEKMHLQNKKIILGVANPWTKRKGLEDFIELSKILENDYAIVLVGLNKKQIRSLPPNILGLERTNNVQELVEIYNSADLFYNPTYEDNYPTTNLEAISCGLKVVTYNTGGSPESASANGCVVEKDEFQKNYKKYINKTKFNNNKIDSNEDMSKKYYDLYTK